MQALRAQFEGLHQEELELIFDYFTRIIFIVHQLRRNGKNLEVIRVVEKMLRSPDLKFEFVAIVIGGSKDMKKMMVEELMRSLQSYKQRIMNEKKDLWSKHFRPNFHSKK